MTSEISYPQMVAALKKPGEKILESLSPEKADLLHMVVGISGEAGELLDAAKRNVVYGKELDLANVVEELGDLEFYLEGLRQILGLDREVILEANRAKLSVRYESLTYSDKEAVERKDKHTEPASISREQWCQRFAHHRAKIRCGDFATISPEFLIPYLSRASVLYSFYECNRPNDPTWLNDPEGAADEDIKNA